MEVVKVFLGRFLCFFPPTGTHDEANGRQLYEDLLLPSHHRNGMNHLNGLPPKVVCGGVVAECCPLAVIHRLPRVPIESRRAFGGVSI